MTDHQHEPRPWSREALEHGGFQGFVPLAGLSDVDVPTGPGVYAVLRTAGTAPEFLAESAAGRFRAKDPTAPVPLLQRRWVEGPEVLYVGRATAGSGGRRGLRSRLAELRRYGAGEPVGHSGGRYVWQLRDSADLLVAWNVTWEEPTAVESRMLRDFTDRYGALPFANLRR